MSGTNYYDKYFTPILVIATVMVFASFILLLPYIPDCEDYGYDFRSDDWCYNVDNDEKELLDRLHKLNGYEKGYEMLLPGVPVIPYAIFALWILMKTRDD